MVLWHTGTSRQTMFELSKPWIATALAAAALSCQDITCCCLAESGRSDWFLGSISVTSSTAAEGSPQSPSLNSCNISLAACQANDRLLHGYSQSVVHSHK